MVRTARSHNRCIGKNRLKVLKQLLAAISAAVLLYQVVIGPVALFRQDDHNRPSRLDDVPTTKLKRHGIPTLPALTRSTSDANCTASRSAIQNVETKTKIVDRIPRIVHQTSKSRCVTKIVATAANSWKLEGWSYYFHDDEAVMRLLQHEFSEFPHLSMVASQCMRHGTLKADLWRYLVLWVYGGVYADIDSSPANFDRSTLEDTDDAFFVVEQYHLLSQWFMATSPRHPLMYYAIQQCLTNLLAVPDTGAVSAAMVTGPHALHLAYIQFRKDGGTKIDTATPGNKPVSAGHFVGSYNRTVTVKGVAAFQNEYVYRDVLGERKNREYQKMGMRHFQEDKKHASGVSCRAALLRAHYQNPSVAGGLE
jgi:Glycosyltransferase sugar-binding region containing DXD motif